MKLKKLFVLFLTLLMPLCLAENAFALPLQVDSSVLEKEKSKIVKLETTYNTRDLGGYKTSDGKITKYGVFLRSDDTDNLTLKDIETLKSYGVTAVLDLRESPYYLEHPDKFSNIPGINYQNIDIVKIYNEQSTDKETRSDESSARKFLYYTGEGNWVKTAFDIIADTEGCTLFHCFAGKDRTGLLAMLLLGLVDVSAEDIMQNYSVSYDLIKENPKIKAIIEKDIKNFGEAAIGKYHATPPSKIKHGIDYISENYGTTENYLLACGVSKRNLEKIKNRFVRESEDKQFYIYSNL